MKYNFSKIELISVDKIVCKNLQVHETIGNLIYNVTKDLGLVGIAQEIYAGKEVELSKVEIIEIERIVDDPNSALLAFVRKAIHDYINEIK